MGAQERRQQRRQILPPERGRGGDAQHPGHAGTRLPQRAGERLQVLHQHAALLSQHRALRGGVQPPGRAMQEAHAKVALQPLQPLAGHGHREVEAARRRADRAEIQHAQKQADVTNPVHDPIRFSRIS
ncbi:hypothetical protein D3C85_1506760 [compost metagenome]